MRHLISFFLLIFYIGISKATTVAATNNSSQTWNAAGSPYILNSDCEFSSGTVLTILAGTRIVATGNFKLIIKGEIIAEGTATMPVVFDSLTVETNLAADWNPGSLSGSRFRHCKFTVAQPSNYMVISKGTDLMFDSCQFIRGYYAIYNQSTDTFRVWVYRSEFRGVSYGYPVYGLNDQSFLHLEGNVFVDFGIQYLGVRNTIKGNYFKGNGLSSNGLYTQHYTKSADISCNYFNNVIYGLFAASVSPSFEQIEFHHNEFDTGSYCFYLYCGGNYPLDSIKIYSNNFYRPSWVAYITGCTGSKIKTFSMQDNYWGTTNINTIKLYNHDSFWAPTVPWIVDYSNYLTSPVQTCWPTQPEFLSVKTSVVNQIKIFPNPATGVFNFSGTYGKYHIEICTPEGRKLHDLDFTGYEKAISCPDYKGILLVRWSTENGSGSQWLMVE